MREIPILFSTPIWLDIKGYEGLYQVSQHGEIKSVARSGVGLVDKIKAQTINNFGYKTVCLSKNNKVKRHLVHRIIATAFIPNDQDKPNINHINGNKQDNSICNLEWCSKSENVRHAMQTGLKKEYKKGIPLSDEHRKNISISLKGRKSPCGMRGKKWTNETRIKFSSTIKDRKYAK